MEHLPQGELLAPYRSRSENDTWFTEVRVYATPGTPVHFAVHYTDAAGRAWKQHLDGEIERVATSAAVSRAPRAADLVQPHSQLRVLSEDEQRDPASLFSDVPDDHGDTLDGADDAELEAVARVLIQNWKPVARISTPWLVPKEGSETRISAQIAYTPKAPKPWHEAFTSVIRPDFASSRGTRAEVGDGCCCGIGQFELLKLDCRPGSEHPSGEQNTQAEPRTWTYRRASPSLSAWPVVVPHLF